jgi:hypothetical protein
MKIPAHAKYQIIYDTMQKNDNLLNVAVRNCRSIPFGILPLSLNRRPANGKGGTGQTGFSSDSESIPVPRIS